MDDIRYASRLGGPAIGSYPISLSAQDLGLAVFVIEQREDPLGNLPGFGPGQLIDDVGEIREDR